MKILSLLAVCFGMLIPANANAQSTITITCFRYWNIIEGIASGVPRTHVVVVYAHAQNDKWFIQPYQYVGDEPGWSWAPIAANGHWRLPLVRYDETRFVDSIAALVVAHPVTADEFVVRTLGQISQQVVGTAMAVNPRILNSNGCPN
jgi:hypothetical protein